MKWVILLLFCIANLPPIVGQQDSSVKVHPVVEEYLAYSDSVSCMLVFRAQSGPIAPLPAASKEEKTSLVYDALYTLAYESQKPLLDSLEKWNSPYRPFYIVNAIQAMLDSTTLGKLSHRRDLYSILPDFPLITSPEPAQPGNVRGKDTLLNWGISHIRADSVWRLGITGQGVVVAGLDTGTDWDQNFLRQNYRGYQIDGHIDHNYNWYDGIQHINILNNDDTITTSTNPCGLSVVEPCDDHGHGTFTMGLMTGKYDNQYTGIAPGARWISSRVMERGKGLLSTYLAGLEWCLSPTDINGRFHRPDLAPDIINNSWACPEIEGCIPDNYWILDTAVTRLTEAGIFVITAAGNRGKEGCSSLQDPLAIFPSAFTVGATNRRDSITDFSSRGPIGSSSLIKPEVVAPGESITSIYPGNKFQKTSGTSISAPITAGLVALILEANPALRGRPGMLREILLRSTIPIRQNPCGKSVHPNYVYGYGRIDALNAVRLAQDYFPPTASSRLPDPSFLIYPNPVRDMVHLSNRTNQSAAIRIYDTQGKLILEFSLKGLENKEIAISKLYSGLYFVRIESGNGIMVRKLLKL